MYTKLSICIVYHFTTKAFSNYTKKFLITNVSVRNRLEQNPPESQDWASNRGLIWTTSGPHQASSELRGRCETASRG